MASSALGVQLRAPGAPLLRAAPARSAARAVAVPRAEYTSSLRPYTIRKGDTLDSISKKRGLSIKELQQYNKDLTSVGASASQGLLRARSAVRATAACGRRAR